MNKEDVRRAVYQGFADTGRAPSLTELAARTGQSTDQVSAALRDLHDAHHLVLDATGTRVELAHPFASRSFGFSVMGERTLWWGGCCWDAFAIPHLLRDEPPVLVATRCPGCDAPHAWVVGRDAPPAGDQVAHFLVPVRHMWDDVLRTCGNQRIYCSERCVDAHLARVGESRGYLMDLPTLWRLAEHWYDGRLDAGYIRREPHLAAAYFAGVGLTGPFWTV